MHDWWNKIVMGIPILVGSILIKAIYYYITSGQWVKTLVNYDVWSCASRDFNSELRVGIFPTYSCNGLWRILTLYPSCSANIPILISFSETSVLILCLSKNLVFDFYKKKPLTFGKFHKGDYIFLPTYYANILEKGNFCKKIIS